MTRVTPANHSGMFLNQNASPSLDRMEAAYGRPFAVSRLGATVESQQALVDRWHRGGAANRPPYLYQPYEPASQSPHVKNDGEAGDFTNAAERAWIKSHPEFGWVFNVPSDVVHAIYVLGNDRYASGTPVNSNVRTQQEFLNAHRGENLVVDGVRGPATIAAFKRYQTYLKSRGWYAGAIDGIWGTGTNTGHGHYMDELAHPAQPSVGPPPTGSNAYRVIQTQLNKFGYGLVVDNIWGPRSHNALGAFQVAHGLTKDYKVGPATWAILGSR